MALFFWDASGLAKRYILEDGNDTANALFTASPALRMATTPIGYAETFSILLRRRNGGLLDAPTFSVATASLQTEVLSPRFDLFSVSDAAIFSSLALMRAHNFNATDAAILRTLLDYAASPNAPVCVLVASDTRLLRAADAEGLPTLNPELVPAADVPDFLAAF